MRTTRFKLAFTTILVTYSFFAAAQISNYSFSHAVGLYQSNGGTSQKVVFGPGTDDATSALLDIGFNFVFDQVNYTRFAVNSNGFLTLGTASGPNTPQNALTTVNVPTLAPLWDDLKVGAGTTCAVTYQMYGAAPERILVVEWKGMLWDKLSGVVIPSIYGSTISFQAKLYEGSSAIQFAYNTIGDAVGGLAGASIGIAGVRDQNQKNQFLSVQNTLVPNTSNSTEQNAINVKPLNGALYTFSFLNQLILPAYNCREQEGADRKWVISRRFDEAGNVIAEQKQYIDDFGRSDQQQVRLIEDNNILATQTLYDANGLPAIQTLPASLQQTTLCYKNNFVTNEAGQPYSYRDFDLPATASNRKGERNNPAPLGATVPGTLGWYYSPNNSIEPYVAASNYPYTRTEYYDDPLGRVKRTAMAGVNHKLGSGHETRYFYMNSSGELAYVFGLYNSYILDNSRVASTNNEMLQSMNLLKTISINATGQERLSFTNTEGKSVATCLSGYPGAPHQKIQTVIYWDGASSVDIHLPAACISSMKLRLPQTTPVSDWNDLQVELYDLDKERTMEQGFDYHFTNGSFVFDNGYSSKSNFLRVKISYTDAFMARVTYYANLPDFYIDYETDYSEWSVNFYDKRGRLVHQATPQSYQTSFDPLASGQVSVTEMRSRYGFFPAKLYQSIAAPPQAGKKASISISLKTVIGTPGQSPSASGNTQVVPKPVTRAGYEQQAALPTDEIPLERPSPKEEYDKYLYAIFYSIHGVKDATGTDDVLSKNLFAYIDIVHFLLDDRYAMQRIDEFQSNFSANDNLIRKYDRFEISIDSVFGLREENSESPEISDVKWKIGDPIPNDEESDAFIYYSVLNRYNLQVASIVKYNNDAFAAFDKNQFNSYYYDQLNRMTGRVDPDRGLIDMVYNKKDRLRFSQDARQRSTGKFNYYNYDLAGRMVEQGEYDPNLPSSDAQALPLLFETHEAYQTGTTNPNKISVHQIVDQLDGVEDVRCTNRSRWGYDREATDIPVANYQQRFLLGRPSKSYNDQNTTWYSYDEFGRITWTIEKHKDLSAKTIDYVYDMQGNLLQSIFQKNNTSGEAFNQYYTYDKSQRLQKMETKMTLPPVVASYSDQYNLPNVKNEQVRYAYYLNGPLKRTELNTNLQGTDYVYTINGWLKSINHPSLDPAMDPGRDGLPAAPGNVSSTGFGSTNTVHAGFAQDAFGMTLDYFYGDYYRPASQISSYYPQEANATQIPGHFDGKIKAMRWRTQMPSSVAALPQQQYAYKYDYQQRLTDGVYGYITETETTQPPYNPDLPSTPNAINTEVFVDIAKDVSGTAQNTLGTTIVKIPIFAEHPEYRISNLNYDHNGNIQNLYRKGPQNDMDKLTYHFAANNPNRLESVTDAVSANSYSLSEVAPGQSIQNYGYDASGNLISDLQANRRMEYDLYGRITAVYTISTNTIQTRYYYDERGFKSRKTVYSSNGTLQNDTWYLCDVQGNELAVYEKYGASIILMQLGMYGGAGRIGTLYVQNSSYLYELKDHLGSVRAVISRNPAVDPRGSTLLPPTLQIEGYTDYYPHGSPMPGRQYIGGQNYRLGYQGQEKDKLNGLVEFDLRQYNSLLGRWLSTDPMAQYASPYLGMGNNPVSFIDPTGGSDLPGPSADKANVPWYYLTPSEVNAIRESRGMTYQAQEDAMIMELAAMGGGYRDGDGNLFTFDRRGNLQKTTSSVRVEIVPLDESNGVRYHYVFHNELKTELVNTSNSAQSGSARIDWKSAGEAGIGIAGGSAEIVAGLGASPATGGASVLIAIDGAARVGLNSVKMYFAFKGDIRAQSMPTNLGGLIGSSFSPTGQAIGGIINDGLSITLTGGMAGALSGYMSKPTTMGLANTTYTQFSIWYDMYSNSQMQKSLTIKK